MTTRDEQIKSIAKALEKHKSENKHAHFTYITPDEPERMLGSPWIAGFGWNDSTTPGGTVNCGVGIQNPGPNPASNLYVHVWVSFVDPSLGTFLLNVDTRFGRLTQPNFSGLSINAGAAANFYFSLNIPATVEKTNYLLNICLTQFTSRDGKVLDNSIVLFAVE